jgi:DNA-directed RNA polymerase specialized sigma24 family protein
VFVENELLPPYEEVNGPSGFPTLEGGQLMSDTAEGKRACSSPDRRCEDEQLLATLRATQLQGTPFDGFVTRVIDYATGVLWKMVRDEEIWAELGKIGRPRTPPAYWGERDKEQLVMDSVTEGFLDFRQRVLVDGEWDPSRASLNTLFVRYCLSRFADHYQTWQRQSLTRLSRQAQHDPEFRGPQQVPSAERVALAKQDVNELSPEQFARGAGYSYKEIGQMRGITERAVEGRLYRDRGKNLRTGLGERRHDHGTPTA